jgi:hypothetical protein
MRVSVFGRVYCFADPMSVLHDTEALMYGMQYQARLCRDKGTQLSRKN